MTSPPDAHRSGKTYDPRLDAARLNTQARKVWDIMRDRHWRTLGQIEALTGYPQPSISARLRDFRKARCGAHTVQHKRDEYRTGLWWYRLVPNNNPDHMETEAA